MKDGSTYWDDHFFTCRNKIPTYDLWLDSYGDILQTSRETPIIDLGCGLGNDTLYLRERGYKVISCDFSKQALQRLYEFLENPLTKHFDMTEGLPFKNQSAAVVIADLSLHYFSWQQTKKIVADISRVLVKGGYLLARVNSVRDSNYGAGQGAVIEDNFYCLDGRYKRFFNKEQINELFKEWTFYYCAEYEMNRYKNSKILWEIAVRNLG